MANNKGLNIALWLLQIGLGLFFIMVGFTKASQEINVMVESIPWANEYPEWLVRFIGISEVLGGLGLIIPTALRWRPRLTITASRALILVMFKMSTSAPDWAMKS